MINLSSISAEVFDVFGIGVFTFLLVDSIIRLTRDEGATWRAWTELVIGILGLIVDGGIILLKIL